jgi:hypothetical protein
MEERVDQHALLENPKVESSLLGGDRSGQASRARTDDDEVMPMHREISVDDT